MQREIPKIEEKLLTSLEGNGKENGKYVGTEEDAEFDEDNQHAEDDGLGDMWNEMSLAIECAKVTLSISLTFCFGTFYGFIYPS